MNNSKCGLSDCGAWALVQEIGRGAYGVVYMAVGPGGNANAKAAKARAKLAFAEKNKAGRSCQFNL